MSLECNNIFYLRLPVKVVDEEQVRKLHSDIEKVTLPRQKSTRWCKIQLRDSMNIKDTIKALKQIEINGKPVVLGPWRLGKDLKKLKKKTQASVNDNKVEKV